MTKPMGPNPFTPDFGMVPRYFAGRSDITRKLLRAFESESRDPNLTSIFVGARGTGKTALLSYLGTEAQSRGWITVDVTAEEGMLEDIVQRGSEAASHLIDSHPKKHLSSIEIGPVGSLAWESEKGEAPNWRTKMNALLDALNDAECGLLITVDEVDPSLEEMVKLATTYQHFIREGRRVGLLMAGLPHNVSDLVSGKKTSFLRRASQYSLGSVSNEEIASALSNTLKEADASIEEDALEEAMKGINGFPFMLQLVGFNLWEDAAGPAFTLSEVRDAVNAAQGELRRRVLDATMRELSDADIAFLYAMLADDVASSPAEIGKRLNRSSSHVSIYKKRLLESGVIEETVRHNLRFCLPGFREYLIATEDDR